MKLKGSAFCKLGRTLNIFDIMSPKLFNQIYFFTTSSRPPINSSRRLVNTH